MVTAVKHALITTTSWNNLDPSERDLYSGSYSLISTWEAAQDRDLDALDEKAILHVYDDWSGGYSLGNLIFSSTWNCASSSDNTILIRAAAGQEYNYADDSGAWFDTTLIYTFQAQATGVIVNFEKLKITSTKQEMFYPGSNGHIEHVDNCRLVFTTNHIDTGLSGISFNFCLLEPSNTITGTINAGTKYRNSVLIVDSSFGAVLSNCECYNTVIYNSDSGRTYDNFYACTGGYNSSNDTSAPGDNSVHNIDSTEFEDYENEDYHLASYSQLVGAGWNLIDNGPQFSDPQVDLDGDEWPGAGAGAWDLGFDCYKVTAPGQIISIGLATETNQAQLIDTAKNKEISQTNENDTAQSFTSSNAVSILQAIETDIGFSTVQIKTKQINQGLENNQALSIGRTKSKLINLSVESNSAFLLSKAKQSAINLSQENDESFVFTVLKNKNILLGVSSEVDVGSALNTAKIKSIIQALESDAAHPFTFTGSYIIGTAVETDSAAIVDKAKALNITIAEETDSSFIVDPSRQLSIGQAFESDSSFSIDHSIAFLIDTADELDSAFNLLQNIYYTIGMAEEFDSGFLIKIPGGGYIYACKLTANINDTIEANICS